MTDPQIQDAPETEETEVTDQPDAQQEEEDNGQ